MKLFHVSEDGAIGLFEPRPSLRVPAPGQPAVWAIAGDKLAHYLLPRDCPRVCFATPAANGDASPPGLLRSPAPRVVAIESEWFQRALAATLFLYELPAAEFSLFLEEAGYWVAYRPVAPVCVTEIENPLSALLQTGAELRILPSLWELHDTAIEAGTVFSMIRMRNAKPRNAA